MTTGYWAQLDIISNNSLKIIFCSSYTGNNAMIWKNGIKYSIEIAQKVIKSSHLIQALKSVARANCEKGLITTKTIYKFCSGLGSWPFGVNSTRYVIRNIFRILLSGVYTIKNGEQRVVVASDGVLKQIQNFPLKLHWKVITGLVTVAHANRTRDLIASKHFVRSAGAWEHDHLVLSSTRHGIINSSQYHLKWYLHRWKCKTCCHHCRFENTSNIFTWNWISRQVAA